MEILNNAQFNEFAEACGNRYLALQLFSEAVRKLESQYAECRIPESKFLTWVLTGQAPYSESKLEYRRYMNSKASEIDNILCQILDKRISDKVTLYYKRSVRNRHLTLCEDDKLSQPELDKINILLRMIWYNFTT